MVWWDIAFGTAWGSILGMQHGQDLYRRRAITSVEQITALGFWVALVSRAYVTQALPTPNYAMYAAASMSFVVLSGLRREYLMKNNDDCFIG